MRTPRDPIHAGHRYPADIISYGVWLYFRFPLSLRMIEEVLAARGISVTHETIRQWGLQIWPGIRPPDPSASPSPWRHRTKFAADSPLEQAGFEISVPPQ
jgi:transposase-like protein